MASSTLTPHVGDHGYWIQLVQGDPGNVVRWADATLTVEYGMQFTIERQVVPPGDVLIQRDSAGVLWRPAPGVLDRAGTMLWAVVDVTDGMRRVIATGNFTVLSPFS